MMKKHLTILSLVLLLGLAACGTETADTPVTPQLPVKETARAQPLHLERWSVFLFGVGQRYDCLALQEEDAKTLPALDAALDAYARERGDAMGDGAGAVCALDVRRADSVAVSLLSVEEPAGTLDAAVFDAATGARLGLDDVVTDQGRLDLMDRATALLTEKYPELDAGTVRDHLVAAANDRSLDWTLDPQGISLYLDAADVSSWGQGLMTVLVPFGSGLVDEGYAEVPAQYAVPFGTSVPLSFDFGTGTAQELRVVPTWSEETGACERLTFYLDEESTEVSLHAYEITPILVHMGEGEDYLYLEGVSENDYPFLEIYALFDDRPPVLIRDTIWGTGLHRDGWTEPFPTTLLTDPTEFLLDTRMDLLSTYSAHRSYHIAADGALVPAERWYTIDANITLTSLVDLQADVLGADRSVTEAGVLLPAGTKCTLLRTDGSSWVEVQLDDGRECRLSVTNEQWPQLVDGKPADQCFDGMLFAG